MGNDYTPVSALRNRDNNGWRIEWDDDSRETNLIALVWYALNWDDEATVTEL